MKTKLLVAAAALAVIPALSTPAAVQAQGARPPAPVVVVVDTDRVLRECTACVAANTSLRSQEQSLQARRQQLVTQLQNEGQPLQTEAQRIQALPAGAARTTAENALRPRLQAFENSQNAANSELQNLAQNLQSIQSNVVRQINERVQPIFTTVMNNRGANLMIPSAARLANSPALDVTNDVLQLLNQQLPSVSLTPLPQAPGTATPTVPPQPRPAGR
jgi:outer membrane protein